MKLSNPLFSKYTIEEFDELGRIIVKKLKATHAHNIWTTRIVNELEKDLINTQKAIGSSSKKAFTNEIKTEDDLFNQYFIGFRNSIYSYNNSPNDAEAEASEVLRPILEKNDDHLYNRSYAEQSAKYHSLSTDLQAPIAIDALQTLNKIHWKEQMDNKLQSLEQLITKRNSAESEKDIPTNKDAKNDIKHTMMEILEELKILYRRNIVNDLEATLLEIEESVKKLNANARARQTRGENKVV